MFVDFVCISVLARDVERSVACLELGLFSDNGFRLEFPQYRLYASAVNQPVSRSV